MPAPTRFRDATRRWFDATFDAPTPAQEHGWAAIASGEHTLIHAPTGSGKTLAAFLSAIDGLLGEAPPPERERCRVLYISPLKALAFDIERNLRAPLAGIALAGDDTAAALRVGLRTGDTPPEERRAMQRHPPDILITTPESLYLLLTSAAREILGTVRTVIVDEVHAVAGSKRGAHLALTLERLEERCATPPQRIGLSATQRPLSEIARFLGGHEPPSADGTTGPPRAVRLVDAPRDRTLDLTVLVPVEDMGAISRGEGEPVIRPGPATAGSDDGPSGASVWPSVWPLLLELLEGQRSTVIFVNSRRLAERVCARLNEAAGEEIARAHHGSVAREQRIEIEEALKAGRLRAVVATSSLELGIDMGAIDLVIQVEAPASVAQGLQRVGRAGHHVGGTSRGVFIPKYRGDLLETAHVVARMHAGAIEETRVLRNPLDVLTQQVIAMCALDDRPVDPLYAVVRRAAPFADLGRASFDAVLDMASGRYPSDAFAELTPRLVWDRAEGVLRARPNARPLAIANAGTIPDRGLYGVFLPDGARVGELDEEMVYESRPGETFILGASTWRIDQITRDRVIVVPAPGEPGKMPFWHGDSPGRPVELGRSLGAFVRELAAATPARATARLLDESGLDARAATNVLAYLEEQAAVTGALPSDRTIVVERFRDEIGDWRVCILTPFGGRVHAPWALAIGQRLRERHGIEAQTIWTDDGIILRLPEADEAPAAAALLLDPNEVEEAVLAELPGSALFAARFRESAARALLLPRRRPGSRTPLWQQRQRAADLLTVASQFGSFPIILETVRECMQDHFDVPGLVALLQAVGRREVRVVEVETEMPSPFAASLLFAYVAGFMYEGEAPLAERKAQALSLDRALLAELLGEDELRELLSPAILASVEDELQRVAPGRRARSGEELSDIVRRLGPFTHAELAARSEAPEDVGAWLEQLAVERRVMQVRVAGEVRWAAVEDAARLRDALGVVAPPGIPDAFLAPVPDPLGDLVARYARGHGPFVASDVGTRLGMPIATVHDTLRRLGASGRVAEGAFRPGGIRVEPEWCDVEVLRRLRRRSLAVLRREVEPVEGEVLARFITAWQGVAVTTPGPVLTSADRSATSRPATAERVLEVVAQLEGVALPASIIERDVLPARLPGYHPGLLDELCSAGIVAWLGRGPLGNSDGRLALVLREHLGALAQPGPEPDPDHLAGVLLAHLRANGASFFPELYAAARGGEPGAVADGLWDLVWAGHVTNDTLAPLRAFLGGRVSRAPAALSRRRLPRLPAAGPPSAAGRWSPLRAGAATSTERAHLLAVQLLERHGVLTRAAALAEEVPGGFAAVYPVLRAMEEAGHARRGYFVAGLGGAQFALPGAVDRLRAMRTDDAATAPLILAAADPANPYGAALSWPETPSAGRTRGPSRTAGAYVAIAAGVPIAFLERGARKLTTFTADIDVLSAALQAFGTLARDGRVRRIELDTVDGTAAASSVLVPHFEALGFVRTAKGFLLRPGQPATRPPRRMAR